MQAYYDTAYFRDLYNNWLDPTYPSKMMAAMRAIGISRVAMHKHVGHLKNVYLLPCNQLLLITSLQRLKDEEGHIGPFYPHPAILSPSWSQVFSCDTTENSQNPYNLCRIDIVDILNTQDVTLDHVLQVDGILRKSGVHLLPVNEAVPPGDIRKENIGLLPDGTPLLFDFDYVAIPENRDFREIDGIDAWLMPDGQSKQLHYFPHIARGAPKGLIPLSARNEALVRFKQGSKCAQMIQAGFYPEEITNLLIAAVDQHNSSAQSLNSAVKRKIDLALATNVRFLTQKRARDL